MSLKYCSAPDSESGDGHCMCRVRSEDSEFCNMHYLAHLEQRVKDGEKAMAEAYAWPNDGHPCSEHVKFSLRKYRDKYPSVFK